MSATDASASGQEPILTPIETACRHGRLTLDDTVVTWVQGRVCLGCGMPVKVTVEHYQEATSGA